MFEKYRDFISVADLMEIFSYSRNTIYKMLASGDLKGLKLGKKHYVLKEDLETFVSQKCMSNPKYQFPHLIRQQDN